MQAKMNMYAKRIGVALAATAVLYGCAGTAQRRPAPASSDVSYPNDPADEARQTGANVVAHLTCTCLFVEESTPERCSADLPAGMNKIIPDIDRGRRTVVVTMGRWTAQAQDQGPPRGCHLR